MSLTVTSYVPSLGAAATRAAETLSFPFNARPQAMTVYLRFFELGTASGDGIYLFIICDSSSNNPAFMINSNGGGPYRIQHSSANSTVIVALAATPSTGDLVELVGQLNADGSVVLIQSINSAASTATAATAATPLATAWSATTLHIGTRGQGDQASRNAWRNILFHRGVQTIETMRRLAGVI